MKKSIAVAVILAVLSVCGLAQTTYKPPTVYAGTLLVVKWTAGTINNGGHLVTIAANSGTGTSATASQADCSAPSYAACNFIYTNNSGTVAQTTTLATAQASGNVILAYIETNGTTITRITFGWQNGTTWSGAAATSGGATSVTANDCGTANACSPTSIASGFKIFAGKTATLNGASPSVAAVTGLSPAYTSTTSYHCTGTINSASANTVILAVTYVSGSAFTFTAANAATGTIEWICVGN